MVFDNSKLKKAVPDFRTEIRAEEGIRRTVQYVLSHRECQQEDEAFDKWCDKLIDALEKVKKDFYKMP